MKLFATTLKELLEQKLPDYSSATGSIKTGFHCYDDYYGGIYKGELIIVAGRPGNGLEMFLNNLAINQAIRSSRTLLFFDTRKSSRQHTIEIVRQLTGKRLHSIPSRRYNEAGNDEISSLPDALIQKNLLLEDECFNLDDLVDTAWKVHDKHVLDMIVVDDLAHISRKKSGEPFPENRTAEKLSRLAIETGTPVVIGAHLEKELPDHRNKDGSFPFPSFGELNNVDVCNQADKFLFLHRPDYYKRFQENSDGKCILWVAIDKSGKDSTELVFNYDATLGFSE